jgi:CO dehydrogenase/acetyl-CoA synthase alpha subunit
VDVAVVRQFIPSGRISNRVGDRVVEHELDMNRNGPQPSAAATKLRGWMRWLMPGSHPVGAPMRSVDRELEDVWPSGNRQT